MSAKHALLGLLLQRSSYPYELADRMRQRLGPGWEVNSGQLYQTIDRLESEGLIERVADVVGAREDRHVFRATPDGEQEFQRWFDSTTRTTRLPRRPLTVKLTLAGPDRLSDALAQIDDYERQCAARLSELSRLHESVSVAGPRVRADHVLLRLSLSADIFALEAELRWARHAHEMVSWLLGRDAIWPSATQRAQAPIEQARSEARGRLFERMAREGERE